MKNHLQGECCEKCQCKGHPRDEYGNSVGHDGNCHNTECKCHDEVSRSSGIGEASAAMMQNLSPTNATVERIVEEFVKQKPKRKMSIQDCANELDWLRTTLTTFQSDIRRELIEEILAQLPVEPDYMAEDYFSKGREAYRLEIRTILQAKKPTQ